MPHVNAANVFPLPSLACLSTTQTATRAVPQGLRHSGQNAAWGDLSTFVTGKSYKNAQTSPDYTTDALSLACALRRCALEDMGKDVDLPVFDQLPCPCPSAWPCGALLPADRP